MTCDSEARGWSSGEKAAAGSAPVTSPAPQCRRGRGRRDNKSRGRRANLRGKEGGGKRERDKEVKG